LKNLADEGNKYAEFEYGKLLESGIFIKQNLPQAMTFFSNAMKNSVQQSIPFFIRGLKLKYSQKSHLIEKEVKILRKLVNENNEDAVLEYGKLFEAGIWFQQNYSKAMEYFKKACVKGGYCSYECLIRGLKSKYRGEDNFQADVLFLKKCADDGNECAALEYGILLEEGKIIDQNLPEAMEYFKQYFQKTLFGKDNYIRALNQKYCGEENVHKEVEFLIKFAKENGCAALEYDK
jgi:TPR repeat protein